MTSQQDENGGRTAMEQSAALSAEEEARKKEQSIVDRLGTLTRFISGRWNLTVTTEVPDSVRQVCAQRGIDPDDQWYRWTAYDLTTLELKQELVHIPASDLKDITAAKGKAAHEAAHVRIGRFMEFVPQSVQAELGFSATITAIEERPTDECVRKLFPGAGEWLDHVRRMSIEEGNAERETSGSPVFRPKFLQLCKLIVYEPHLSRRAIRQEFDPDVVSLYETIRDAVERVEHTLPAKHATEEEAVEAAKERYRIMYAEIWPVVRLLAEQDATREAIRRMFDAETVAELLRKLSTNLRSELEARIGAGTIPKTEADRDSPGDPARLEGEETPTAGESTDVPLALPEEKDRPDSDDQTEADEHVEGSGVTGERPDGADAPAMPIPDDCTPELLAALNGHFEEMTPEEREALLAQARARLAALEASIVESLRGVLSLVVHPEPVPDTEGIVEEQEPMESEPAEAMRSPKEVSAMRLRTKSAYDKAYEQVRNPANRLYARFLPLFRPRIAEKTGLKNAGNSADLRAVFRRASAKAAGSTAVDHRIFRFPLCPTVPDDAHAVLLDLSGSMGGEKIKLAFSTVVLYAEVLSRLRVRFEILGFQDELIIFKEADEALNEMVRQRMSGMLLEPANGNPAGLNHASYNDDGPCLIRASERLDKIRARRKFLHVFSDGEPAGRYSNARDLRNAVTKIRSAGQQALIGYGMGPGTSHVGKFYPVSLPNIPLKHLVERAGNLLSDLVIHPGKYGITFR